MTDNKQKLYKGERLRTDGRYEFRITKNRITKSVSAKTLSVLREKEEKLKSLYSSDQNIKKIDYTLNDMYEDWKTMKRRLRGTTRTNYCYMYERFAYDEIGHMKIKEITNSDVQLFYAKLYDEKHLMVSTIESVHSVVHQLLDQAVKDDIIRKNPADKTLKDLKEEARAQEEQSGVKKVKYLEAEQEKLLFSFMKDNTEYQKWYPLLKFIDDTGIRIGEACALQKSDIDFKNRIININKTLQTYVVKDSNTGRKKTVYAIGTTKTDSGKRELYLSEGCEKLIIQEMNYYQELGIKCKASIGQYNDFLFLNKEGSFYKGNTVNKALKRIKDACNDELLKKGYPKEKLIPHTHCHMLRHSYNTRLLESGVQVEDRMAILGQSDSEVNIRIYSHTSNPRIEEIMKKVDEMKNHKNLCYNATEVESQINQNDFNPTRPTLAQYAG